MIVLGGLQRQQLLSILQCQGVEELRSPERFAQHPCAQGRGVVVHHVVGPEQYLDLRHAGSLFALWRSPAQ